MLKSTSNEYARLAKNDNNVIGSSFGEATPRTPGREAFADGDVFTIPSLEGHVVTSKIRNSDQTASYILVDVTNGSRKTTKQWYPSSLSKARMKYDPATKMPTGEMYASQGDVNDSFLEYETLDAAFKAFEGKEIKVSIRPECKFKTMPYGGTDGETALQNCTICDFNWK